MEQNKITTKQIWFGIFLVILLTAGYLIVDWRTSSSETETRQEIIKEVVREVILKRPTCPDTSESFAGLPKVILASNLNSYGDKGLFVNKKVLVVKSIGSGSQVACGYLYVKAHAGNRPLQLKWEHPYIKSSQFGGHIITDNAILNREVEKKTEFLFNLSKINYRVENNSLEVRKADWVALLNVSDRVELEIALNTADKTGVLDEVSIAYQCWSPETGQPTTDCQLTVEN